MSANVATFKDYKPAYLKRSLARSENVNNQAQPYSVVADMADGVIVTQYFFNFARCGEWAFEYKETKLVLLIASLCGDGGRTVEMFDEEIAQHAGCTDRTIREWRKDYLAKARKLNYFPLDITQGEYDAGSQRYAKTSYALHPDTAEAIERAVTEARAMPIYERDRLKALETAAGNHYDEIPNAPPKGRTRKPKKSLRSPVIQNINNASKNLTKGKESLDQMQPAMRAALLAGEGETIRGTLEEMRAKIDKLLAAISEGTDTKEVSYMPEVSSGTPPEAAEGESETEIEDADGESHFRVEERTTRKALDQPKREHTPEDFAAFDNICAPLLQPKVTQTDVVIESHAPTDAPPPDLEYIADGVEGELELPDELYFPPETETTLTELDADELAEAEAMRLEACGEFEQEQAIQ
jgi:predicted transcriptional regulator